MKITSSPPREVREWVSSAPHCKGTHPGIGELAEQETPTQVSPSLRGVTLATEDYSARSPPVIMVMFGETEGSAGA